MQVSIGFTNKNENDNHMNRYNEITNTITSVHSSLFKGSVRNTYGVKFEMFTDVGIRMKFIHLIVGI